MKCSGGSEQKHASPACSGGGSREVGRGGGDKSLDWSWPSLSWTEETVGTQPTKPHPSGACVPVGGGSSKYGSSTVWAVDAWDRVPETQLRPSILAHERSAGLPALIPTLSDGVVVSHWRENSVCC